MIRFLAFAAALPLVPVIGLVVIGLSLYRALVSWIIGHKFKGRYAGMLAGSDAIWGLDEDRNSGVVNVLGFVEGSLSEQAGRTPQQIVTFLTERFQGMQQNRSNEAFGKLFLQRNRSLGLYFWTRAREVKLSDYIRLVRINENATVTEKEIYTMLTHQMMSTLPSICPLPILRLLSNLFRITASVSIMPPLKHSLRLGSYELSDVYFWPPAFGSVGVNLTAFSYGGQLRLTLLADRTLFQTSEQGQALLNEFFSEMGRMERVLSEC
ncbi:conserved hypothetical protein [Culex quinquefasciatus]|uniref:O-acyltransferase WSD1 C-terminal domain-containing protein n=1 Tax=Culex quinquefasciatus TaxID=7176 RepID=B0WFN2_CULQU|nr:conserved hypothetical protein [Culex quinquefasciatus]|eukprot:XP_001847516.1 conserved hypothetical protein [Culex quinquefasciatus]